MMLVNVHDTDRSYRRGAIMGLTMAEAFILISFALLLLFAFWQWEVEKENTPDIQAFKDLPLGQRQTVLSAAKDGSLDAFVSLTEKGMDFSVPATFENPQEKWRFIDKDDIVRLMDAASQLPDDMQHDLADLVEDEKAHNLLREMGVLQDLVDTGQNIADLIASSDAVSAIEDGGRSLDELLATAHFLEELNKSGRSIEDVISAAEDLENISNYGRTLDEISEKIRVAEEQEAALVGTLRSELGSLVSGIGGKIDDSGAIILPDTALFQQGKAQISSRLGRFLAEACSPWLTVLKNSGVNISEVKIEGHASSEWRAGSSASVAYLKNLDLSQRRSQAVLRFCLDFVHDRSVLEWARRHLIAVGYSSVRPVLRDGQEDSIASRRVVFSVTSNRKSLLDEIETDAQTGRYDRALFGGWVDDDGDCLNTRHEILDSQSLEKSSLSPDRCKVENGRWRDLYTGQFFTNPRDIEIDHLVPLKWAWDHGAHKWGTDKRVQFSNDLQNLFPVEYSVNREKGYKGLLDWLPPNNGFHCPYVTRFLEVVQKYDLTLTLEESSDMRKLTEQLCP